MNFLFVDLITYFAQLQGDAKIPIIAIILLEDRLNHLLAKSIKVEFDIPAIFNKYLREY
jgi:hypothetical protein